MGSGSMPYEGGCLCRANRYEILRKHLNAMHCYCEMCREAHGGANEHVLIRIGGTWCAEGITF